MRSGVVLDGLHFPHIVDLIFEDLPIEDLPSCSQVCHHWRSRVKDFFSQVCFNTEVLQQYGSFEFRNGELMSFERIIADRRVCVLLRHCEVMHSKMEGFGRDLRKIPLDGRILANVKCYRAGGHYSDGLSVLHIKAPSTPIQIRDGRISLLWENVRRIVFTVRDIDWDMEASGSISNLVPYRFDSITFLYLCQEKFDTQGLRTAEMDRYLFKPHWLVFQNMVRSAWKDGRTVTVVNASSLDDLDEDPFGVEPSLWDDWGNPKPYWPSPISEEVSVEKPAEREKAADVVRRLALNAVIEITPPGPVCPVQFVTLADYRARVGELEFALETEKNWISRIR